MLHPTTSSMDLMPNSSVTSRCWHVTLSYRVHLGNRGPLKGGGVFDGDEDCPFPNRHTTMMKYLLGSSALPGPISHSLLAISPEYHCVAQLNS